MSGQPQPAIRTSSRTGEIDPFTLARAASGDRSACRALVACYESRVFAVLGRMLRPRGLAALVEDLAQDTFLRAFAALPRFDPKGSAKLSTWIVCIASRLAINELKRQSLGVRVEVEADAELRSPGTHLIVETRRALYHAIASLTAEQQAVFVLREFHELTDAEIAEHLGLGIPAVKSRLFRARAQLRAALSEDRDER